MRFKKKSNLIFPFNDLTRRLKDGSYDFVASETPGRKKESYPQIHDLRSYNRSGIKAKCLD